MVFAFELIKHSNVRYRDAVVALSACELDLMLRSLKIDTPIEAVKLGGADFLRFECRDLTEDEISYLSGHSSLSLLCSLDGESLLRPLEVKSCGYLQDDLPEILKYKGKTAVPFTRMMINCAASLTPFAQSPGRITFLDPLCGKGTGCFCAACAGMNAVGVERNTRDVREAADFFSRYLKYHHLKHQLTERSETAGKTAVPLSCFEYADTKEHFRDGDVRTLTFACADTGLVPSLFRRSKAQVLAADLPYGVQHAPATGGRPEPLIPFLKRALPAWKSALASGGALALSFNTLTLPTAEIKNLVAAAGLTLVESERTECLTHTVEQAVVRNVIFALNH